MQVLITGSAGFIGFHLARRLLDEGHSVTGFDGMTPYYDVALKERRHAILARSSAFRPVIGMIEDSQALARAVEGERPDVIIHLAAQAGVRYSLENPGTYVQSNLVGSFNILELARALRPDHLLLASTSSIYGANARIPFAEDDRADEPLTLYAASKKSMELMAHSYAHLHRLPITAFRFFTVYGPWGRPDMALFKFVSAICDDRPIEIFGEGAMSRDFTYVDDLVEAVIRLVGLPPAVPGTERAKGEAGLSPVAPYRLVNIGHGQPVGLLRFIDIIEDSLGKKAIRQLLPMQRGDVPATWADSQRLESLVGTLPATPIEQGIKAFVDWYLAEYGPNNGQKA